MLHGPPRVYTFSDCHQMIIQQQPKGPWRLFEVTQKVRLLSQPMPA